jgi:hypothetical protein
VEPVSLDDRLLRESWRERAPAGAPSASCPDPARIWSAVALEVSSKERRSLIDHVAGCALCAETWRLAAGLGGPPRPLATTVRHRATAWPRLALAAASIVVVSGLGWLALERLPGWESALRATEPVAIRSLLREGEALPRDGFLLRWTPGPPGTIYDLEVGTIDLKLVTRAMALTVPEYLVPEEALAGLAPGASIAWRVEATLPDGRVVASVTHFNAVR